MLIIAIFSAEHCGARQVSDGVAKALGLEEIHQSIVDNAAKAAGGSPGEVLRAMEGPAFVFNRVTHRRERYLAHLRASTAGHTETGDLLVHGFAGHLIPREIAHMLKVCLVADTDYRAARLQKAEGLTLSQARRRVRDSDERRAQWTTFLFDKPPWDKTLYDVKVPMSSTGIDGAVELLMDNANKDALKPTDASRQAAKDFTLAARAELALCEAGLFLRVGARQGEVTVTVDDFVVRFEALKKKIASSLAGIDGLSEVAVEVGKDYRPTSLLLDVTIEMPEKVLLVDDERDFALTLSERLQIRDVEPALAHDGAEALEMVAEEPPDVMVLDLKMPGIDGIEVLRKVRAEHADVQVIVLTGHGDAKTRELCLELGAFAYLEKPVDIEVLTQTMKEANERARDKKRGDT